MYFIFFDLILSDFITDLKLIIYSMRSLMVEVRAISPPYGKICAGE